MKESKHKPTLIIIDDPMKDEAMTDEKRKALESWYQDYKGWKNHPFAQVPGRVVRK